MPLPGPSQWRGSPGSCAPGPPTDRPRRGTATEGTHFRIAVGRRATALLLLDTVVGPGPCRNGHRPLRRRELPSTTHQDFCPVTESVRGACPLSAPALDGSRRRHGSVHSGTDDPGGPSRRAAKGTRRAHGELPPAAADPGRRRLLPARIARTRRRRNDRPQPRPARAQPHRQLARGRPGQRSVRGRRSARSTATGPARGPVRGSRTGSGRAASCHPHCSPTLSPSPSSCAWSPPAPSTCCRPRGGAPAGAGVPQLGAMSAARWATLLRPGRAAQLPTAFALKSLSNTGAYLVGPASVSALAAAGHPVASRGGGRLLVGGRRPAPRRPARQRARTAAPRTAGAGRCCAATSSS